MKHSDTVKLLTLLVLMVFSLFLSKCETSKSVINYEHVKNGQQLDKAIEITVTQFFHMWLLNKEPQKLTLNTQMLYTNDRYAYFGKNSIKGVRLNKNLYKVAIDSLHIQFPNFKNIEGENIRSDFWDIEVPESDRDIRKTAKCSSSASRHQFNYGLHGDKIEITLNWRYRCNFKKLINKSYHGYYDMNKLEMVK